MKQLVIISGKGGTGKTSIAACFAALEKKKEAVAPVIVDCDVDAANLAWLDGLMADWLPLSQGHYVNEIADDRHPERVRGSFSDDAWARLAHLREAYDPGRRFHGWLGADR